MIGVSKRIRGADMSDYVLARGQKGARRLELLAAAMWPSTKAVLARTGVEFGARCLDLGCGIGTVTCEIARMSGHCKGVDVDSGYIESARRRAEARRVAGTEFEAASWEETNGDPYDLVYARYLLSHLSDPLAALRRMKELARPGGTVVVEDIDFEGHFHHPPNAAFVRYLNLYESAVQATGGNARYGRHLLAVAREAGLVEVEIEMALSIHHRGPGKMVAELTLEQISEALFSHELCTPQEVETLLDHLRIYRQDPTTQMSLAPTFQLIARAP